MKSNTIDIRSQINTMDDIFRLNGTTAEEFESKYGNLSSSTIGFETVKLIVATYNEGHLPDYSDPNQIKWEPYFKIGSPSGAGFAYHGYDYRVTASAVGSRLAYLSYDNMKDAVAKFLPQYEQFYTT